MVDKPKNLGKLFKESFEDFEVREDSSDWSMLEMKLEKMKFFRFGLTSFNIYYATLIALTFAFSSGMVIDYFFVSKKETVEIERIVENKELEEIVKEDSKENPLIAKDSFLKTENSEGNRDKKSIEPSNKKEVNTEVLKKTSPILLADTVSADTIIEVVAPIEKKEQKKAPQKKIIYITKQDTLIVVDSVKTKNKRKK